MTICHKLDGSIEIGDKGSLAVNGTDTENKVDVTQITGVAEATVSFAKDAELTGSLTEEGSNFFWKDGTVITNVSDLLGRTFTWKDGSAVTRSNNGKGFYADENKPKEPTLDEAMLGNVTAGTYSVSPDTEKKTVTVTTAKADDNNVKVTIPTGVNQTIDFTNDTGVSRQGDVYTVTFTNTNTITFNVTVKETGKADTVWTITVTRPSSTSSSR